MKILYIIDSLKGYGAERSVVNLGGKLRHFTPVFIQLYRGDQLKYFLEEKNIKVYSLNLPSKSKFDLAVEIISPIIQEENPVIIHSTLFRADMISRKLKRKFPNILLVGSLVSNSYGKNRYNQLSFISKLKLLSTQCRDRFSSHNVDYFISNSFAIKNTNIKALGLPEKKIKVIYRGRKMENPTIKHKKIAALKKSLNIRNEIIFLNVGRLSLGKGQIDLIRSFKIFAEQRSDVMLFIAGEGSLQLELENLIKELDLGDKVFLLGYRDNIPELLFVADFFVFPSYFEGLPGAMVEAIISTTPCIASNIPENKECFPADGALFFTPGNIAELSGQLKEALLIENWNDRTFRSHNYARQYFDIEKIGVEYEQFMQEILERHNLE